GTALYRAGHYEIAVERLRDARAADPTWETAWPEAAKAMVQHRLGRPALAREALREAADALSRRTRTGQAAAAFPAHGSWWAKLQGRVLYREAGRLIDGHDADDDPAYRCRRGEAFVLLDRPRDAVADFGRAITVDPKFDQALDRRADIYLALGDW